MSCKYCGNKKHKNYMVCEFHFTLIKETRKREVKTGKPKIKKLVKNLLKVKAKHLKPSPGYVYVVSNPAWPDWCKLGKTSNLKARLGSYQTNGPNRDYELVYSVYCFNMNSAEVDLLSFAKGSKVKLRGEWVNLTKKEAVELVQEWEKT